MNEFVLIGKIVNTHGIKGEVRLLSDFDYKDKAFRNGNNIYLGQSKDEYMINTYRPHKQFEMLTLKGITNINDAIPLKGKSVYVKRADLTLEHDDYILLELIGFQVVEDEITLGEIIDVMYNKVNALLYVKGVKNFYIPAIDHFIVQVDNERKIVHTKNAKDLSV